MAIHFSKDRMEEVCQAYELWWEGKLDRPLVNAKILDAYGTSEPLSPMQCYDFSMSPEAVIDHAEAYLSCQEYLGDGFPMVNLDTFGPGVVAAFCGAKYGYTKSTVWFYPEKEIELADIQPVYDPDHPLVQRIKAIYQAGLERWDGKVLMGMVDLGGVMDILAGMYGTQNLLFALIDEPEQVDRLVRQIQKVWYEAYEDLAEVLKPQKFFADWSGLMSATPSYTPQCDFCVMISNPMFRRFVLDTLKEDARRLSHTMYHLDGEGELTHLEDILAIDGLNAVQWVPVHQTTQEKIEVCRKILDSGKRVQLCCSGKEFLKALPQLGGSPYLRAPGSKENRDLLLEVVKAR